MRFFAPRCIATWALLISTPSFALDLNVEKTPSGKLLLRAKSCQSIQSQIPSFEQWIRWKGKSRCATPVKTAKGCEADITSCVPKHVVKYQGATADQNGPNCWNLALVMKGILPYLGHANEEEMTFYMSSPLCRRLKSNEKPEPGDIGAIRHGPAEIHAFIHVSDQLAYSKNGSEARAPYLLQPRATVFEEYSVGKLSLENDEEETCFDNPECEKPIGVTYFRCQSMDDYLARKIPRKGRLQPMLRATKLVELIECRTSAFLIDRSEFLPEYRDDISQIGKILNSYVESELLSESYRPSEDPAERFVLGSLALRLDQINNDLMELENHGAQTGQWTRRLDQLLPKLIAKAFDELR